VVISFTATAESRSTDVKETVTYGSVTTAPSDVVMKSADTTTGLSIASKTVSGDTHLITLTGKPPLTIPSSLTVAYGAAKDVAVITFNGILNAGQAARIQQTSPGLEQYVTGALKNSGDTDFGETAKDQATIDGLYAAQGGDAKVYFWKTATPVTYNKMRNYAVDLNDNDFSVLLAPTSPVTEQIVTLTKKAGTPETTTTYIIDYTGVTFDVSSTVKKSTDNTSGPIWAYTTPNLTVASAIQEGSDVYITLAGTNVPKTIDDTFLAANYPGVTGCAVISLDGIFISGETFRYQGANPALQQYVTGDLNGGGTNYTTTAKTQAEIEAAFKAASNVPYFWQTASPVTYNKMVQVNSGTDTVLSIMLAPTTSASDQKVTIIKKLGSAPNSYTKTITYHVDYSGVTFAK
jgi:hypothetical protein